MIGPDPGLRDPEHGDYRPAAGSPAESYGCQTFARVIPPPPEPPPALPPVQRDVIDVSGRVRVDTLWDAALVRVVGDVSVDDGVTLTIAPGVRVEFQDYYRLAVAGTLLAVGTPARRIVFTTDEPAAFVPDASQTGCWNGLRFEDTRAVNTPSRLAYCIIEYGKALGAGGGLYPYGGGALAATGGVQLSVENCILRHNVADYGGAVFLYRHADVTLAGNLIVDNHAWQNAAAVYCAYAYPRLVNNTIVRNRIRNLANPYIESCAVLSFIAKPVFTNNIVRDNDPDTLYQHVQLWKNKAYCTWHNNIQAGAAGNGNIDADPWFISPTGVDGVPGTWDDNFRLLPVSPCRDAGLNDAVVPGLPTDLDGVGRVFDGDQNGLAVVDMGAYEAGDCDGDGVSDADELASGQATDCNANAVPDACEIELQGTSPDCNGNLVPDECDALGPGDFDADGDVDRADLWPLLAAWGGPDAPPDVWPATCAGLYLTVFDHNADDDLDLRDFATWQRIIEGRQDKR